LTKQEEPEVLRKNGATWLKAVENKIAAGEVPTDAEKGRYRHPEIKSALITETHGKCAYCESRLLHIAFGDVEHITPKSLKLSDTFRWSNLTLACDVCNTYKGNAADLVDPYVDDPSVFFKFVGPMVYANPSEPKGVITAKQLRLNRPDLIAHRVKRLDAITSIMHLISITQDPKLKAVLTADLRENEASDEGEYAAFVRSFLAVVDHENPGLSQPAIS
jgi:uncharacterized protein (TIGR02646 family)